MHFVVADTASMILHTGPVRSLLKGANQQRYNKSTTFVASHPESTTRSAEDYVRRTAPISEHVQVSSFISCALGHGWWFRWMRRLVLSSASAAWM